MLLVIVTDIIIIVPMGVFALRYTPALPGLLTRVPPR
jgi:hypothetical protein